MAKGGGLSKLPPVSYSFLILNSPAIESVSGLPSNEPGKPAESLFDHNSRQASWANLISWPSHRAEVACLGDRNANRLQMHHH